MKAIFTKAVDPICALGVRIYRIFAIVIKACPVYLMLLFFCSLLLGTSPVAGSFVNAEILSKLTELYRINYVGNVFQDVFNLIVIKAVILMLISITNYLNNTLMALAGARVTDFIRREIMQRAKRIPLSAYDSPAFYGNLENAKREAGSRPVSIISACFNFLSTLISLVAYTMVLSRFSVGIVALVIAIGIPHCVFTNMYRKKNYQYVKSSTGVRRQMNYYNSAATSSRSVKELRIFGLFDWFQDKYEYTFLDYYKGLKAITLEEFRWEILLSLISTAVNFGIFVFTAAKTCGGEIDLSGFSLYTGALTAISSLMLSGTASLSAIYSGTLFLDNLFEFLDTDLDNQSCLREKISKDQSHTIEFRNVSFSYPGSKTVVLQNINFSINSGETVMIVGLNGSGKTTLIKLLLRLYHPTEGQILLDGQDIENYAEDELYQLYSVVFQDYEKYAETIHNNICFGQINKPTNLENVACAARKGRAEEFIGKCSEGYNTTLTKLFFDNGKELSVGQWQRLAIARSFYREANIFIFDEPTASLDAISESEIMDDIMSPSPGLIKILVSHRVHYAKSASKIIVLVNGHVEEIGTHDKLETQKGTYYSLLQRARMETTKETI